ncbi:MAG TPA: hypothetical protein VNI53_04665 [Gammaproteobacteria bacterium]|nr:hypothetical protein [Gammaproteobacteria bacterium]
MRIFMCVLLFLCIALNAAWAAPSNDVLSRNDGLSVNEFRNLATSLPELPGNIQAIRIFRGAETGKYSVAFTTFSHQTGWQLFVFNPDGKGKFQLAWKSGKLDDTFHVAGPSDLSVFDFGPEDGIVFHGCARHVCPDVFSVLLYVPKKHTSFVETYVWGKISYSFDIKDSENNRYKSILDELVKARRSLSE